MSTTHRIAALVCGRKSKWVVLAFWFMIMVVAGPLAGKLQGAQNNENSSWLPKSAESARVLELQKKFQPTETIAAVVLYERPSGITPQDLAKAAQDSQQIKSISGVASDPVGPIPDKQDGTPTALEVVVPITVTEGGWDQIAVVVDEMRPIVEAGANGMSVYLTGPGGVAADQAKAFKGIDSTLLYAALAVVITVLVLTYRSPVFLLPVFAAMTALTSAQAVIYLLAKHAGLTVNAQSSGILLVLVFGASTDYALLLVARYREELRRHTDRHEAMAFALGRAGPAIIASAATVAVGMFCLITAEMNSTRGMGPIASIGILVGVTVMVTLLPALLVIVGRWIFWPKIPTFGSAEPTVTGFWARKGRLIAQAPRVTWIATALALGVVALNVVTLKADGLTFDEQFVNKPQSVTGLEVLARHFPAGDGQPLVVIGNAAAAGQMHDALAAAPGIAPGQVTQPAVKDGLAMIEATLSDAPDGAAAQDTVDRVRAQLRTIPGADARVGGQTALQLDINRASSNDTKRIMPMVLLVVLVILGILLRALIGPLILIATVVLSFAASMGASAFFFDHVFHFGGADTSFPLFVFVFLVALGIDYNIFLMTRVREETTHRSTRPAALIGLAATGGVITSAGLVLAGTFAALGVLPVVFIAELGFAVAFGVLLDTFIVRSVLVTALTLDVGRWMWWPSKLTRIPDVPAAEAAQQMDPAAISGGEEPAEATPALSQRGGPSGSESP